jgi:hypothetical protein
MKSWFSSKLALAFAVAAPLLAAVPAHAEKRVALVIGNNDYRNRHKPRHGRSSLLMHQLTQVMWALQASNTCPETERGRPENGSFASRAASEPNRVQMDSIG